jgi:serine/threonine-protein kinase
VTEEAASPPDPRIGSVLQGRYLILSRIASGAMGVVYKGERVQLGRAVAVKFLHPWIAAQKTFLSRFENEAKAMSRLLHPHCVSVIDFGVEGSPYLVMDFVTGRTLRDRMLEGQLPVADAMRLAQQLLAGLAHAHAQGIVHRDLKPENLILSAEAGLEEHLRILDFGLAKLRDGPAMTAGMAVGTPSYMSPEQSGAEGEIDARTDIYTVGVLLFELLAGRKPFQSDNVGEVILMHREAPPPHLRATAPQYSEELDGVVQKAMSKRPADRFQSAADLAAALAATPEGKRNMRDAEPAAPAPAARKPAADKAPPKAPPRPADATTVDSLSAVRRRMEVVSSLSKPVRQWRLAGIGLLFMTVVMLALLIGRGLRHSGEAATASPQAGAGVRAAGSHAAPPAASAGPAAAPGPENPALEQARQLVGSGQPDAAIAVLNQVRAQEPDNADALYLLAMVNFDNRRWADGLAAAQIAVRKNPAFKSDPDLIKGAIKSLVSDRGYDRSQGFLRSLGSAATPFLKTAAQSDPSPKVRERAAELLSGGGRGWPSRSSSSSSSMFKR